MERSPGGLTHVSVVFDSGSDEFMVLVTMTLDLAKVRHRSLEMAKPRAAMA